MSTSHGERISRRRRPRAPTCSVPTPESVDAVERPDADARATPRPAGGGGQSGRQAPAATPIQPMRQGLANFTAAMLDPGHDHAHRAADLPTKWRSWARTLTADQHAWTHRRSATRSLKKNFAAALDQCSPMWRCIRHSRPPRSSGSARSRRRTAGRSSARIRRRWRRRLSPTCSTATRSSRTATRSSGPRPR